MDAKASKELIISALRYQNAGNFDTAKKIYLTLLRDAPDNTDVLHYLGVLFIQTGHLPSAIKYLEKSLSVNPAQGLVLSNLGHALSLAKNFQRAVEMLSRSIALDPKNSAAYSNRANALFSLGKIDESEKDYQVALELEPHNERYSYNYANFLFENRQFERALHFYNQAISCAPDFSEAYFNRGMTLDALNKHVEAIKNYESLVALNPEFPFALGALLYQKLILSDWQNIQELIAEILRLLRAGKPVIKPFGFQAISNSESDSRVCAQIYSNYFFPPANEQKRQMTLARGKIKIGYVCGEFRDHATLILLIRVLELHDKNTFEIIAFDNGYNDSSKIRSRFEAAVDKVVSISTLSDQEVSVLIAEMGVSILVNLNGFYGASRQGIFARRSAPIQVNYLGFPGTLGAAYFDYIFADEVVLPITSSSHYLERVVRLEPCYQPIDDRRTLPNRASTRSEHQLPDGAFVFACFNNNYKFLPPLFDSWARILTRAPFSVLWLLGTSPAAEKNMRQEFRARQIDDDRIIFASRVLPEAHLERHHHVDLMLDSFPYNAHTTASDALWMGVPIVTLRGTTFPGRVCASILQSVGLNELIAETVPVYEEIAVGLSQKRENLNRLREVLLAAKNKADYFRSLPITRALEGAYINIFKEYCYCESTASKNS